MPETEDSPKQPSQVTIARWIDRFFAWLIDYIIVTVGSFAVFFAIYAPDFENLINEDFAYERSFEWLPISLVFFIYWIIIEYKTGQSIGKLALHLKITNLTGEKADLKSIIISSFGKSFPTTY